jgi:hypothetical protein
LGIEIEGQANDVARHGFARLVAVPQL